VTGGKTVMKRKYLEESRYSLVEIIFQNWRGGTEKNHANPSSI
jgi:hypothetical protein